MANTVIRLKKSSISGRSPTTLEHGELAINYTDGKLFYKDDANVIQRISGGANSFMYMNVNSTMLVAGVLADVLTVNAGDNIEINTDALTNKYTITANLFPAFRVANAAFALANDLNNIALVVSNTAPTNPVQGKLWWHNTIGTLFVYYVDQDGTASWVEAVPNGGGVTTSGGGTTDYSPAFNVANAAFAKANTVNTYAYGVAVNAAAAFNAANNAVTDFSPAFNKANNSYIVSNAAFDKANSSNVLAYNTGIGANNYAGAMANAANAFASSLTPDLSPVFIVTNSAFGKANSALANTSGVSFNGNLYFPTGSVGIGTTSPVSALHVQGTTIVGNTTAGQVMYIRNLSGYNRIDSYNYPVTATQPFMLNASNVTFFIADSAKAILDASGNFGIGNTSPGAKLHIAGANTVGGTGYADFLRVSNDSHPGVTNKNKTFRLNSTGGIEVINSAYSATILSLNDSGNLTATGTITAGAWTPGQVIKDTMLSNSELTVLATTVATSTSDTDFVSYSYTPVSSSSYLIIHMHVSDYSAAASVGSGTDSYFSRIKVDGNEITYSKQYTRDTYTFRSGVLFPLTGRYTNSSTSAKSITVAVRRDTADDNITITNSPTALWMRITEIAR